MTGADRVDRPTRSRSRSRCTWTDAMIPTADIRRIRDGHAGLPATGPGASRWSAPTGPANPPSPRCCCGSASCPRAPPCSTAMTWPASRPTMFRSVVGGCPQDPHLFSTTIRDNLRLARPDATDEQLEAARGSRPAAPVDPLLAPGLRDPRRHRRGGRLRRRTAAAGASPGVPGRPGLADPRRAHRPPGPACPPGRSPPTCCTPPRAVRSCSPPTKLTGSTGLTRSWSSTRGGSSSRAATGSPAARADTTSGCERTNISRSADRTVIDGAVSPACSRTGYAHRSPAVSSSALAPALSRGELRIPRCNGGYTNGRTIPAARVIPAASTSQLKGAGGSGTRLSFAM